MVCEPHLNKTVKKKKRMQAWLPRCPDFENQMNQHLKFAISHVKVCITGGDDFQWRNQ